MPKDGYISVLVSLPVALAADVDLALFDPLRGKLRYGARSRLFASLLSKWLSAKRRKERKEENSNGDQDPNYN